LIAGSPHLDWPFFDDGHRTLHEQAMAWAAANLGHDDGDADPAAACRALVKHLGEAGWLRHVVPAGSGGVREHVDVRSLCILREILASHSGLADFAFAMQGLGTGPISLFGSESQKQHWLPPVAAGRRIAAFAISEAHAGSDITAMRTTARRDADDWILDGAKTWISNAGIADHYIAFARLADQDNAFGAFIVDATTPGLHIGESIEVSAPHVLGSISFENCRVPAERIVGQIGAGLKVALATLDVFRPTVGAAAIGFARRALDEATRWVRSREAFGRPLAEHQMTLSRIADMALDIDASALLVYRAAWLRDSSDARSSAEAAMAKLHATEAAQRVVDSAVQLLGGRGIVRDSPTERLYREVRALRIYEGTSEIQRLVIASHVLRGSG
jgi:acyl-CoA dehydrogenase